MDEVERYHRYLRAHPKKQKKTSDAQIRAGTGKATKPHLKRYVRATHVNGEPWYVWVCSLGSTWGKGVTREKAFEKYECIVDVNKNAQRDDTINLFPKDEPLKKRR